MFWFKPKVEAYEDEFKTKKLRKRRIFYEIYTRVNDPEEVRVFANQLLDDLDYRTLLNELTKVEDEEEIFKGGRLKPLRGLIKSYKKITLGIKYPNLVKFLILVGIVSFLLWVAGVFNLIQGLNLQLFQGLTIASFVFALIVLTIKRKVNLDVWIKLLGIYDVEREKADLRIIIAGDVSKFNEKAIKVLEEDMSEIYDELGRKYVKKRVKKVKPIISEKEKSKPEENLLKAIRRINKEIERLNERLAKGEVSEETYKKVREELLERRRKLEIILDILGL